MGWNSVLFGLGFEEGFEVLLVFGFAAGFGGGGEDARGLGLPDNGARVGFDGFFYGEFFRPTFLHELSGNARFRGWC
jgi:hypothetical protein